jgi:hypothetical protein
MYFGHGDRTACAFHDQGTMTPDQPASGRRARRSCFLYDETTASPVATIASDTRSYMSGGVNDSHV